MLRIDTASQRKTRRSASATDIEIDEHGSPVTLEPSDWLVLFVPGLKKQWWHPFAHARHKHCFLMRPGDTSGYVLVEPWWTRMMIAPLTAPQARKFLQWASHGDEAQHPGESAFRLLSEGHEAFVVRSHSAQLAMRSLDVQTFIWRFDLTGRFLAHRVLQAADRGVRVRLLVDDMDARDNRDRFAALAAHPNIAVRIFNPFVSRRGVLRLIGEGLARSTLIDDAASAGVARPRPAHRATSLRRADRHAGFIQTSRGFVKRRAASRADNRHMSTAFPITPDSAPDIAAALAKWYCARSSIRQMWAIDRSRELEVLVTLEPTSDGGDTLPIWLANKRHWTSELQRLAQRELQLKLVALDDPGECHADPDAIVIAELNWRVSW